MRLVLCLPGSLMTLPQEQASYLTSGVVKEHLSCNLALCQELFQSFIFCQEWHREKKPPNVAALISTIQGFRIARTELLFCICYSAVSFTQVTVVTKYLPGSNLKKCRIYLHWGGMSHHGQEDRVAWASHSVYSIRRQRLMSITVRGVVLPIVSVSLLISLNLI